MIKGTCTHVHESYTSNEMLSVCIILYREALVLGESEATAKDHFRAKLHEARRNAWSTSLNWYVHGLAKDNRQ